MGRKLRKSDIVRLSEADLYLSGEPWGMGMVYWVSKERPKISDGELDFRNDLNESFAEPAKIVNPDVAKMLMSEEDLQKLPAVFIAKVQVKVTATVYDAEGNVFTKWDD